MTGRWELTDEQWIVVVPVLRPRRREDNRGRPWHDTRAVLNGVFWVLGTGAQWRELPEKYPPYQTCHRRFQQWIRSGKLEEALKLLARHLHERGRLILSSSLMPVKLKQSSAPWRQEVIVMGLSPSLIVTLILVYLSSPSATSEGASRDLMERIAEVFPEPLIPVRKTKSD